MKQKFLLFVILCFFVEVTNAQFQEAYVSKYKTNLLGTKLTHYEVDTIYLEKQVLSMPVRVDGYATPRLSKYDAARNSLEKCINLNSRLGKEKYSKEILKAQKYISIISDSINTYIAWADSIRYSRFREREIRDSITEVRRINREMEMLRIDSIKSTFIEPKVICEHIGFITKEKLENTYGFEPRSYYGGDVFYDLPMCNIGITYMGRTDVAACISFRLFGEDGYAYMKQLYENGFEEIGQVKTLNLEIEPDWSSLLLDGKIIKFMKKDPKGKIICEVMCGSYFGFTFYRSA